jgi:FliI/YscN family ATPase
MRQGQDVLLMMDSVTRFAMAQREVGLSAGEPPSSRGYTPSVFALLPRLMERAGTFEGQGSITGIYTVLVEGDDMNDPIADAVRATLDGHIVLSRHLAAMNHYPAIDILSSVSRLSSQLSNGEQKDAARRLRESLASYHQSEDLINLGAYLAGTNPKLDAAIRARPQLLEFLQQDAASKSPADETLTRMRALVEKLP